MSLGSYFRGAMAGTGLGDSIGRSREGYGMIGEEAIRKGVQEKRLLRYTDDTQQMMALAESLVESRGFDGQNFANKLVQRFDPTRGYGPGSSRVIKDLRRGNPWDEPATRLFGGEGSYGNGSSMRIAPVGLYSYDDLDGLKDMARNSSSVTHVHSLGKEGAVLQATSVALATRRDPSSGIDGHDFLTELRAVGREEKYEEKLDIAEALLDMKPDRSKVVEKLGNGIEAFNSVPTAVYCFLSHPDNFEEAVLYAVGLGGDADTIGAMSGAIAGAYHGYDKIPEEWGEKLEDGDEIIDLADKLLGVRG